MFWKKKMVYTVYLNNANYADTEPIPLHAAKTKEDAEQWLRRYLYNLPQFKQHPFSHTIVHEPRHY